VVERLEIGSEGARGALLALSLIAVVGDRRNGGGGDRGDGERRQQ
jgi:hypothetical protein